MLALTPIISFNFVLNSCIWLIYSVLIYYTKNLLNCLCHFLQVPKCLLKISSATVLAVSVMAATKGHDVTLVERFQEFRKIFFDPCQSHRRIVIGGVCILTPSDNPFTESAKKLNLLKATLTAEESSNCLPVAADGAFCRDEDACEISEGVRQYPDIVKSAEDSELVPSPTSPDIVPEMEGVYLQKPWSEPCTRSRKASWNPSLQRTVSYEEPVTVSPPVKVERQISASFTLRRLSSAYGSQDQSLSTAGRKEDEDDQSLNQEVEEQLVLMTPPSGSQGVAPLSAGVVTTGSVVDDDDDDDDDDDESTFLLPVNVPLTCHYNHSLTMDHPSEERSFNSDSTSVPTMVAGYQLTDDNEFQSICVTSAEESFVTATDVSVQEQIPLTNQPLAYAELCTVVADLENRLIQQLLIGLLHENCSPEFVRSVAEALFLPAVEPAAVGNCTFFQLLYTRISTHLLLLAKSLLL